MSSINKIKLPSGTTYDVNDVRIPGVDNSPRANSENVVKSGGIYNSLVWLSGDGSNSARLKGGSKALESFAVAEGASTIAEGAAAHSEGYQTIAVGYQSHSEGSGSRRKSTFTISCSANSCSISTSLDPRSQVSVGSIVAWDSPAFGYRIRRVYSVSGSGFVIDDPFDEDEPLSGEYIYILKGVTYNDSSHSEGGETVAIGAASHSEGRETIATGSYSHAEGQETKAEGVCSHAEGYDCTASGWGSHAEGADCVAYGGYSHAEGDGCYTDASSSHAEGVFSSAYGEAAHSEGYYTITSQENGSHAEGSYNIVNNDGEVHMVGIGNSSERKNADTILVDGSRFIYGIGGYDGNDLSANKSLQHYLEPQNGSLTQSEMDFIFAQEQPCPYTSVSCIVIDDYPEDMIDEFVEDAHCDNFYDYIHNYIIAENRAGNYYYKTNETLEYDGQTYTVWENAQGDGEACSYGLLSQDITVDDLWEMSMEYNLDNRLCPFDYILDGDMNDGGYGWRGENEAEALVYIIGS